MNNHLQPHPVSTPVFCRFNGKLARFEVATDSPLQAVATVKTHLARNRTKPDGAVLALIETPEDTTA